MPDQHCHGRKCRKCGWYHRHLSCPARDKNCFKCFKKGHFARLCLSSKSLRIEKRISFSRKQRDKQRMAEYNSRKALKQLSEPNGEEHLTANDRYEVNLVQQKLGEECLPRKWSVPVCTGIGTKKVACPSQINHHRDEHSSIYVHNLYHCCQHTNHNCTMDRAA